GDGGRARRRCRHRRGSTADDRPGPHRALAGRPGHRPPDPRATGVRSRRGVAVRHRGALTPRGTMGTVSEVEGTAAGPVPSAHGSDFLQLRPEDAPAGGKADWLAERLRQAIGDRRLTVGSRLPATRVLAAELRVSRGVVTEAYRRLAEDGHVEGRGRGCTVVVAAPPA